MNSALAPIILFVYNRPDHTRLTLDALSKNILAEQSELFIFCDGEKPNATTKEKENIAATRKLVAEKKWCKEVTIIKAESNQGLAKSIIKGVTEIVNKYEKVIVVEDDIFTSPLFLTFMNKALNTYADFNNIYSVTGYAYPIGSTENKTVLLPYISCWGWGTWKDKWKAFDWEADQQNEISQNTFLSQRFNMAHYDYANMLATAKNSWGIKWYYSVFKRNGLVVFLSQSLVRNIGFDASGTHGDADQQMLKQELSTAEPEILLDGEIDFKYYVKLLDYFTNPEPSVLGRMKMLYEKAFK